MHLQRCLILLQKQQFLIQILLASLFDPSELSFVEILGPPESVKLVVLLVFLYLPSVEDDKSEPILGIEIPNDLQLLASGFDLPETLLEHVLNWVG